MCDKCSRVSTVLTFDAEHAEKNTKTAEKNQNRERIFFFTKKRDNGRALYVVF